MNGPEHYAEAERLLKGFKEGLGLLTADTLRGMSNTDVQTVQAVNTSGLAAAQAHATLALTAATVYAIEGAVSDDWAVTQ